MKNLLVRAGVACTLLMLLSVHAHAVETEVSDMDDLLRAKVAKHKARKASVSQSANANSAAEQNESGGCGAVDIGNSVGSKPGKAPKEIVVVITGDVINANNKCKK